MVGIVASCWLGSVAQAEDVAAAAPTPVDVAAALEQPKKAKWDPKGKAIDPFGRGDAKRKQEQWGEAIPLLVEAVDAQPGCGKCLNSLARALVGNEQYDDAVKVGELMAALYPDRNEGWARVSDSYNEAERYTEAVEATTKFLGVTKDDSNMWWRRNRLLIQLGDFDGASKWIGEAEAAGLPKEDSACLKVQVLAATGKPVDARELWPTCDGGTNVDLRRYSEGWIALSEGDSELAATRLVMAGADDFARLTIAFIRIEQNKHEMALNLSEKLLVDNGWALDGHLAHVEALHGLGRDAEAAAELDAGLMAEGWAAKHPTYTLQDTLLKPKGETWPKQIAQRAAVLRVAILAGTGDVAAASTLADQVKAVYGESAALSSALDAAFGGTGVGRPAVAQALTGAAPALKKCFDKDKKKNAQLAGTVVVGFTIGADGAVSGQKTQSTTLTGAPDLEKCALDEVAKLKFTVTAGAQPVNVTYPITFPL